MLQPLHGLMVLEIQIQPGLGLLPWAEMEIQVQPQQVGLGAQYPLGLQPPRAQLVPGPGLQQLAGPGLQQLEMDMQARQGLGVQLGDLG